VILGTFRSLLIAAIAAAVFAPHDAIAASPPPRAAPPKAVPAKPAAPPKLSAFDKEQQMSFGQLMKRWNPLVAQASKRFDVPQTWLRAVMAAESGGRTMSSRTQAITSSAGALGLMQLMPQTYREMRAQYRLGPDPQDPHDNIFASAAYLHWLFGKYGYPQMFAAYNDGPGNLEERLLNGRLLPAETRAYVSDITLTLQTGGGVMHWKAARFTRPNGQPVMIGGRAGGVVRAALPGEYAPGVQAVITVGRVSQGVRESVAQVRAIIRGHRGKR